MGTHWIRQSFVDETIAERYRSIGGFTHGFDYLRIGLAMAVVIQHSILSSYGDAALSAVWGSHLRIVFAPILLMFFGLSGFLVTGSLKKNPTATSFLTLRAIRLVPALAVEVLLSALLLGPFFTKLPLGLYFADHSFWRYMLNVVGMVHRELPGVFTDLPSKLVNVSIWTIPFELECYVAIIALYVLGFVRRPWWVVAVVATAIAIGSIAAFSSYDAFWANTRPLSRSLVVAFLVGVAINLFADWLPLKKSLFALSIVSLVALTIDYRTIYFASVPAVYLCVYLGMMHPPKRGILFSGDYSYGLYLFAYPIQQTYTALLPQARIWYLNAIASIVLGLLYASFSWWCIEKPTLSRKQAIVGRAEALRDRLLSLLGRKAHGQAEAVGSRIG